jgi:cytochrome c
MKLFLRLAMSGLAMLVAASAAHAEPVGDAAEGEKIFRRCQACHMVGENAKTRVGPVLNNVIGAVAGAREDFNYSPAMKGAGEQGLVWTDEALQGYLENPRAYMPGNRMAFAGLKSQEERDNVIAYLHQFSDDPENGEAEATQTQ